MSARSRLEWFIFAGLTGAAAFFVYAWQSNPTRADVFSIDTYYYYLPNMLHAAASMRDAGRGLLWNAQQNCGQPFLGINSTAALYPINALFLFVDPDLALRLVTVVNLSIAGGAAYLLCRQLDLGITAASCGALAFALGNATVNVATWTPFVGSAYVWLPAILLGCERVIAGPSFRRGVVLALVIVVALLPGFPQVVFFAYQLIALRVLWELVSGRMAYPVATLFILAVGLFLPVLIDAVQLLPGLEAQQLSIRAGALTAQDIGSGLRWQGFLTALLYRREVGNPVILVPFMIASCSLSNRRTRRMALFFALTGLLYLLLALGDATPLFAVYRWLPLGSLFRLPTRFLWVTGFCLAMLTAYGVEAVVARRAPGGWWPWSVPVLLLACAGVLRWLTAWSPAETTVMIATIAAAVLAVSIPSVRSVAGGVITAAIVLDLLAFPLPAIQALALRPFPLARLLPSGEPLAAPRRVFAKLRPRLTMNDRAYLVYQAPGIGTGLSKIDLGPKTGGVFGVPMIHDYEPQPSQRYAEYYMVMRTGRPPVRPTEYYLQLGGTMPPGFKRRLLNLAAGRYLIVEADADTTAHELSPPPPLVWEDDGIRLYENAEALPRAAFIPRIETVADPAELLTRLANGNDDLRQIALVERPPASGFSGEVGNGAVGAVEFLRNDPEDVVLRVQAPTRGFLHLADQYFPGWLATVNGQPAEITRANYLFRLVEVPAGESVVEFRYRPRSVYSGAAVSLVTITGIALALIRVRKSTAPR